VATDTRSLDDTLAAALDARAQGDLATAEAMLRRAMDDAPCDPRPRQFLGAVLTDRQETGEAIEILAKAVELAGPLTERRAGVYNNYANALRCAQQYEQAEEILRELVVVAPKAWQHWHNLAHVLKDTERFDEAVSPIRRAIALAPEHGPNHAVLGSVLHSVGRLNSAAAAFNRCIELGSDSDVNVWTQLGNTYRMLGDMPNALEALERANRMTRGAAPTRSNLAIALVQLGRLDEAREHFATAIEIEPENDGWKHNLGYCQLTAGELPDGWYNWEYAISGGPRGTERPIDVPRWTPDDSDVRVLCYREQGVGDEILFASVLPDLAAHVREVIYECDARLEPLFTRSFPNVHVRPVSWSASLGQTIHDFDCAIPIGSLGLHFRSTVDMFPEQNTFLVADPERVAARRAALRDVAHGNAIVGVSWRSRIKTAERRLEYTHLSEWGELFATPNVTWVSLQYDDCERELHAAEQEFGVTIHRWRDIDYMNDFEEVSALMTVCDLVVAPRNAVAMLSGALGRPTVMMGNRWDWSDLGTDSCPWLPSIQLVCRHVGEDWDQVLASAAARVRAVASGKETA
jgi:Flp pilus assembly protein TadD